MDANKKALELYQNVTPQFVKKLTFGQAVRYQTYAQFIDQKFLAQNQWKIQLIKEHIEALQKKKQYSKKIQKEKVGSKKSPQCFIQPESQIQDQPKSIISQQSKSNMASKRSNLKSPNTLEPTGEVIKPTSNSLTHNMSEDQPSSNTEKTQTKTIKTQLNSPQYLGKNQTSFFKHLNSFFGALFPNQSNQDLLNSTVKRKAVRNIQVYLQQQQEDQQPLIFGEMYLNQESSTKAKDSDSRTKDKDCYKLE